MKLISKMVLILSIILVSFVSVADLIYRHGHPVTYDGHIHMTTMNQFAQALSDGEFPVSWANNFANFGHPLANIAHQTPAYLGGLLILAGLPTELAYKLLIFLSITTSSLLFYVFFRKFANSSLSFTATVLSVFFPYRALNIYTRGGLPEIMATVFLPVLLLGVWNLHQKKYLRATLLFYFGVLFTALTHPMMLLIYLVPVFAYLLYGLNKNQWKKDLSIATITSILGGFSASYYLIPLFLEMKYFLQSGVVNNINNEAFLSFKQLYDPTWFYTLTHPGPRANYIKLGFIEFIIVLLALILLIKVKALKKSEFINKYVNKKALKNLLFWLVLTVVMILLITPVSMILYKLPIFNSIQYPWRFLTALQITIPLVFIFFIKSIKFLNNKLALLGFIILVLCLRIPQFYGKNYVLQPESDYYFNQANLHSANFNTVWSDNSLNYEQKTVQAKIIEGEGEFKILEEKNASRHYQSNSDNKMRIIDYTFYFPNWTVYVDNQPIKIQYQDLNYRGLITYWVPAGSHDIRVVYEQTNIRKASRLLSLISIATFGTLLYLVFISKKLKIS